MDHRHGDATCTACRARARPPPSRSPASPPGTSSCTCGSSSRSRRTHVAADPAPPRAPGWWCSSSSRCSWHCSPRCCPATRSTPSPGSPAQSRRRHSATTSGSTTRSGVQYGRWLSDFVTGDLGGYYSVTGERPVMDRVQRLAPRLAAAHDLRPGAGAGHRHPGRRVHRLPGRQPHRQGGQRHGVRLLGHPQLRHRPGARVLRGGPARVVAGQRLRETERRPRRAPPPHGAAGHLAWRSGRSPSTCACCAAT